MALKRIPVPVNIDLEDGGKRIIIAWQDGRATEHAAFELRADCPCAGCVDEISGKRTLRREDVDPEVGAVAATQVGRYAVQFQWSDGHTTGIYAYERLREHTK
jgi:DUF971 family protein